MKSLAGWLGSLLSPAEDPRREMPAPSDQDVTSTGTGWTRVIGVKLDNAELDRDAPRPLLKQLTPVGGSWGTGRLLDAPLVSVRLPEKIIKTFPGPAHGPAGLRASRARCLQRRSTSHDRWSP